MTAASRLLMTLFTCLPVGAMAAIDTPLAWQAVAQVQRPDHVPRVEAKRRIAWKLAGGDTAAMPVSDVAAASPEAQAPAWPAANLAPRVLSTLRDSGRTVVATGQRLALDAWAASLEVTGDLWPLTMPPSARAVSAVALGLAGPSQSRALRLGDLPELLSVEARLSLEGGKRPLSLQQAIEMGVAHSLEVQAAQARLESFRQTAEAARGALRPNLAGRIAAGRGQLESVSPHEQRDRKEGSLTLRQALFDLPAMREVQRQDVLVESGRLQWQAAVSSASLQVSASYMQALQARLTLELGSGHERLLDDLLSHVSKRADAGGTSVAERDRVKARVANARAQQADARANLRAALRSLATLIGEEPSELMLAVPPSLAVPQDADAALVEARRANRELVAGRTEAEAAGLEARGQRARFLPRLELEVSHSRAINSGGSESYSQDTKAMLVLNWSLLNGGTDLAQGRAAAARMREKQLLADDMERKLAQDLEASYASLESVAERYTALREELVANRSVVAAFQAQLVGGNRPLLDVLDAYQRLHQSRIDLAQLVLGEVSNHAKVAHITGRLAPAGARP